jgi:hypothetical protein
MSLLWIYVTFDELELAGAVLVVSQGRSTFSPDGLPMASFRASGAHVPSARCAAGHENPPFSARHLLKVDRP